MNLSYTTLILRKSAANLARAALVPALMSAGLTLAPGRADALGNDTVFLRGFTNATYDNNVFRIADGLNPEPFLGTDRKSDTIWGYGAGIRLDAPISQQRIKLDASATKYDYQHFDQLDFTGYKARGSWDWRAGELWHGVAYGGFRKERQGYISDIAVQIPRLMKVYDGGVDARYALTTRWELQGGLSTYKVRLDNDAFDADNFDSNTYSLGAAYKSPLGNSTGFRVKYEKGDWPDRPPSPPALYANEYKQYTLSAVVDWYLTGKSRLYGDAGYTWRENNDVGGRDFDGPSGRLNFDYYFTGKTTGRASVYETRGAVQDLTATYTKTTGLDLSMVYQATEKTQLEAKASFQKIDYAGQTLVAVSEQRQDKYTMFTLGAAYELMRTVSLSGGATYTKRSSNVPFGDYDDYTLYLGASIEF